MVKEVTMFTVVCDNCGKDVNKDAEYSAWNEKTFAEDIAMEAETLISALNRLFCIARVIRWHG